MINKNVDINNEEEILKECDFDYFYNSEDCSREMCMFYNDILRQKETEFNKRQALIDLGRIGITLNRLSIRIFDLENNVGKDDFEDLYNNGIEQRKILEKERNNANEKIELLKQELSVKESKWAKFSQKYAIDKLEVVKDFLIEYIDFKDDYQEKWACEFIDNIIKEIKGENNESNND